MSKTTIFSSLGVFFKHLRTMPRSYIMRLFVFAFVEMLVILLYFHVQELLYPRLGELHTFLEDNHLMGSFGGLIFLAFVYQIYWLYRKRGAWISFNFHQGLWIVCILYLIYRFGVPSCYFWPIFKEGKLAFGDLLVFPFVILFYVQRRYYAKRFRSTQANEMSFWRFLRIQELETDEPIESKEEDWLGFTDQVEALFDVLQSLEFKYKSPSLTLGIIAQWGKGKSSFINLLMARVREQKDIVVRFYPRNSKNVSQIQEDFFDAFAKVLSEYYMGFGFLLGRYTKHLGLLGQYEWTRPLESLLTLLLPEKDEQAINAALYSIGRRVYVVIDDLDRLTGEEIIEVLKLVDRNASFNNVVFVMAYDKEYVNNVLRKHLDHGLDHSFIDKYVTWEVTLPEIDSQILRDKMKSYLENHLFGLPDEEKERVLEGWGYVGNIIVEDLASVRHLKRYVNLTLPRYRKVYSKVDPADFFLLSLLQYRHLTIYNKLAGHIELVEEYAINPTTEDRILKVLFSGEMPSDALYLIRLMFRYQPIGREDEMDLSPDIETRLIRNREAFPYYFRYVKDKTGEKEDVELSA